jgi:hypothetical protein
VRAFRKSPKQDVGYSHWLGLAAMFLLLGLWLTGVTWANSDLTAGRFVLFMDERLIFDGVWNILHPASPREFLRAVINGGDQRYGRLLWNVTALASWLPDKLWGESGLIIAERTIQALMLVLAIVALTFNFVRRWPYRLILIFLLLVMPYAVYYATAPKPEPLALLLAAVFLIYHKNRGYNFGSHWVFAGMAFGAKISFLPFVVIILFAAAIQSFPRARSVTADELIATAAALLFGLGIAVPQLMISIGLSLLLYFGWRGFSAATNPVLKSGMAAIALAVGLYVGRHRISIWLDQTFRNTAHGRDEAGTNFLSWLHYLVQSWMSESVILNVAVIGAIGFFVSLVIRQQVQEKNRYDIRPGLLLVAAGSAMLGAVFISAQRLWGFYLMPGGALLLVGVITLADEEMAGEPEFPLLPLHRLASVAALILLGVLGLFRWMPSVWHNMELLARRTENPIYRTEYATYRTATAIVASFGRNLGRPVSVMWDPSLFLPLDSPTSKIKQFWGTYTAWTEPVDLIVLGPQHLPSAQAPSANSASYRSFLTERVDYFRYVAERGSPCSRQPCYEPVARLPDGGEILAKRIEPAR